MNALYYILIKLPPSDAGVNCIYVSEDERTMVLHEKHIIDKICVIYATRGLSAKRGLMSFKEYSCVNLKAAVG